MQICRWYTKYFCGNFLAILCRYVDKKQCLGPINGFFLHVPTPSENFDATKYKLVLSRHKPSVSFLVTKFSGKALQLSFWTKRLNKTCILYISPKKNYPCQLIKTRTWIYCNILWKKRWKNDNRCYSTSNISCLSQDYVLQLPVTILWLVLYMLTLKKNVLVENFCNKIDFSGPISKKKIGCYNTSGFLSDNQYFEILCTFSHSMGDTGCLK